MDNLSPAALSTLKKELEKRVHSAMVKSNRLLLCKSNELSSVNETEILNEEEKKFKRELLTMFVEELKGFVQNYAVQVIPQVPASVYRYPINAWFK